MPTFFVYIYIMLDFYFHKIFIMGGMIDAAPIFVGIVVIFWGASLSLDMSVNIK